MCMCAHILTTMNGEIFNDTRNEIRIFVFNQHEHLTDLRLIVKQTQIAITDITITKENLTKTSRPDISNTASNNMEYKISPRILTPSPNMKICQGSRIKILEYPECHEHTPPAWNRLPTFEQYPQTFKESKINSP